MKTIIWLLNDWDSNAYRSENDLYGGIGYYRVIKPAQVLRKYFDIEVVGADIRHWGTTEEKYYRIGQYDLIISKHLKTGEDASNLLAIAKHFDKKVLVDVDDDYLNMRKENPAIKNYDVLKGGRYFLSAFLELSDGMTVSTQPLKNLYTKFNQEIDVLPNCCDVNDWPKVRKAWDDGKVRIGFAGGMGHNDDLDLIIEPIARILNKYPNVEFQIIGAVDPVQAKLIGAKMLKFAERNILSQFKIANGTMAWSGYPELLASFGWDIALAPLVDCPFNRSKSHIRWLESSMIHCPVIASPVYPYYEPIQGVNTMVDEVTGLFANNSHEWFEKMERLILDKGLRKSIADNAYSYILKNWQYSQWTSQWKKVIKKYL